MEGIGEIYWSGDDEFLDGEVQIRRAFRQVEYFDADDLVGFVVVEDDAGRDFVGFDDGGVVKAEVVSFVAVARQCGRVY